MMRKKKHILSDAIFMVVMLAAAFTMNLLLQKWYKTYTMTPMIFVLGVFLVSWRTQGYFWGIFASLISVLAVNWAFTYPYWKFDLISPECISSAVVMLIVAIMTGALTTRLKQQEKLKSAAEKERMRGNLLRAVSHDLRTPLTSQRAADENAGRCPFGCPVAQPYGGESAVSDPGGRAKGTAIQTQHGFGRTDRRAAAEVP